MEKPNFQDQLKALAVELVTPQRFLKPEVIGWGGKAALAPVIQLPLPETLRLYSPDVT